MGHRLFFVSCINGKYTSISSAPSLTFELRNIKYVLYESRHHSSFQYKRGVSNHPSRQHKKVMSIRFHFIHEVVRASDDVRKHFCNSSDELSTISQIYFGDVTRSRRRFERRHDSFELSKRQQVGEFRHGQCDEDLREARAEAPLVKSLRHEHVQLRLLKLQDVICFASPSKFTVTLLSGDRLIRRSTLPPFSSHFAPPGGDSSRLLVPSSVSSLRRSISIVCLKRIRPGAHWRDIVLHVPLLRVKRGRYPTFWDGNTTSLTTIDKHRRSKILK